MISKNKVLKSGGVAPRPDRLGAHTGEEPEDRVSTSTRDDGRKPDGGTMENPGVGLKRKRIGTWNVRSLYQGKLQMVVSEMERYNIDIMGICEHRWAGQGHVHVEEGTFIYSGTEKGGQSGVGLYLSKTTTGMMLGYNPISDRILTVRLHGKRRNITIIQIYAPTSTAPEEEIENFYIKIQDTLEKSHKQDIKIIMGDFNAKVGVERTEDERKTKGPFSIGHRNESGEKLVNFCFENNLDIMNTFFKQHPRRLYTWTTPDRKTRNQIDYIITQQRWRTSISSAKTYPGADCDTDHELLVADFKIKLKRIKRNPRPIRFDLRHIPEEYNIEIQNKFEVLMAVQEEMSPDELANLAKTTIISTAKKLLPAKVTKKKKYITDETLKAIAERRKLKQSRTQDGKATYKQCSKNIRKMIRQDKKTKSSQRM